MSVDVLSRDVGTWRASIEVLAGPVPNTSAGTMTSRMTCGCQFVPDTSTSPVRKATYRRVR